MAGALLWGTWDDRGMILTWWVISFRLFWFKATLANCHRLLAHQSDRSLPPLFKTAPISYLASVSSIPCFDAHEPASTWGQKVFPVPSQLHHIRDQVMWVKAMKVLCNSSEEVVNVICLSQCLGFSWPPELWTESSKNSWRNRGEEISMDPGRQDRDLNTLFVKGQRMEVNSVSVGSSQRQYICTDVTVG